MAIDLTDTAAIYARARQAYDNQELQAQQPVGVGKSFCSYKGPCAIGVYLTPEQRNIVEPTDTAAGIDGLIHEGIVDGNHRPLGALQRAHDQWNSYKDRNDDYQANAEAEFLIQMWRF